MRDRLAGVKEKGNFGSRITREISAASPDTQASRLLESCKLHYPRNC